MINQMETHVFQQEKTLRKYMHKYNTQLMSWSPMARGENNFFNNKVLKSIGDKYNKTVIKLLAQTPKTLFVYWEISDEDIENYKKQFGENFFETTKPVLKVYNKTLNYSFEVEINDFANSWYLHVNDSKSDYKIELGRRPIQYNENIKNDYIYITSSNEIESPNDHILFNTSQKMVYFRNVKTNVETSKDVFTLSFIRNIGKIYHIYDIKDLYKELYKHEDNIENLSNPSSNTSSQFK